MPHTVVAGLVLAAGAGRRYGAPKALAEGGEWLRSAVAALADGGCDSVWVVLGAAAEQARALLPAPATAVIAPDWARGMGASLRAGLTALSQPDAGGADAAVVHLVDLPDVGAAVVRRLVALAAPGAVARAAYRGQPGHPVLLGRDHWASVAESVTGDRGARDWLAGRPDLVLVECGDLAGGADIDTRGQ